MQCKICEKEVNEKFALPVKDLINDISFYVCSLDCYMKWLGSIEEAVEWKW